MDGLEVQAVGLSASIRRSPKEFRDEAYALAIMGAIALECKGKSPAPRFSPGTGACDHTMY